MMAEEEYRTFQTQPLDAGADWIIMKAVEKDRNRRYETAAEFSLDIQRYLQFEPWQRPALLSIRKFARRNKVLTAAADTGLAGGKTVWHVLR